MVKLKMTMVLLICSFSIFAVTFKPALPLNAVLAISAVDFFVCLFLTVFVCLLLFCLKIPGKENFFVFLHPFTFCHCSILYHRDPETPSGN